MLRPRKNCEIDRNQREIFFRSRYIEQRKKKKGENDDFSRKWGDRGSLEPKGIEAKSVNQW